MEKDFIKALALWKPFWHPVVVYEKIEPHLQPFFKTAFPIILQTIGLLHSMYVAYRQQKNSDAGLKLQALSCAGQLVGLGMQREGLIYQEDGLDCQKEGLNKQERGLVMQEEGLKLQEYQTRLQRATSMSALA